MIYWKGYGYLVMKIYCKVFLFVGCDSIGIIEIWILRCVYILSKEVMIE